MGLIQNRVEAARKGENPAVVCRVPSGWAVMGDVQVTPGYCLLLPDPVVPTLNDLDSGARAIFLRDMATLGDAVLEVTKAVRCNYEMLGNLEPELHCHVFPRYADEDESLRTRPIWFYDWDAAPSLDEAEHGAMRQRIAEALQRRLGLPAAT